jgi:hypothetical protein
MHITRNGASSYTQLLRWGQQSFGKKLKNAKELIPAMPSRNPFRSAKSDVVVVEALIFFQYALSQFIVRSIEKKELTQADLDASVISGTTVGHIIQETTGWPIKDTLMFRLKEYRVYSLSEPAANVFASVLVRSIGKRAIHEPDRPIDFRRNDTPLRMYTMAYITAHFPAYCEVYKNAVDHYPMD